MTAKEKSRELYEKFLPYSSGNSNNNVAKQCALIAVDEIIKALEYLDDDSIDYFQEVKAEIENI